MIVNHNGQIIGKGLDSLAELFLYKPKDPPGSDVASAQIVAVADPAPALEKEIEAAQERQRQAQTLAQELERLAAELAYAETRAAEAVKAQEQRAAALRLLVHQAHSLMGFGIDAQLLEAAGEELPVLEEELGQTRALWAAKIEEIRKRIEEIGAMPHVQVYLADRRKGAKMGSPPAEPGGSTQKSEPAAASWETNAADPAVAIQPQPSSSIAPTIEEVRAAQTTEAELRRSFTAWLHRQVKPSFRPGDLVLTLGLGKAVHLRSRPLGDEAKEYEASVVSSVGLDLSAGQSFQVTALPGGAKPAYRIQLDQTGKYFIGRLWIWEGDPEKGLSLPSKANQPNESAAETREQRTTYVAPPVIVCTLAPANGPMEETQLGRYWALAVSQALQEAGQAVSEDHPPLPPDGSTYLWGTYEDGAATTLELFSKGCGQGLKLKSDLRRQDPDRRLAARTRHLMRLLRHCIPSLLPPSG